MENEEEKIAKLNTAIKFFNILVKSLDEENITIKKYLQDIFFIHQKNIIEYLYINEPKKDYEIDSDLELCETTFNAPEIIKSNYENYIDLNLIWVPKNIESLYNDLNLEEMQEFSKESKDFILKEVNIFGKKIGLPVKINYV